MLTLQHCVQVLKAKQTEANTAALIQSLVNRVLLSGACVSSLTIPRDGWVNCAVTHCKRYGDPDSYARQGTCRESGCLAYVLCQSPWGLSSVRLHFACLRQHHPQGHGHSWLFLLALDGISIGNTDARRTSTTPILSFAYGARPYVSNVSTSARCTCLLLLIYT